MSRTPRRRDDDGVARRAGDRKMRCRCERHKDDPVPNRQSVLRELPVHEERGFLREGGGNFERYEYRDGENVYAYRALEYKYRVEAECGLYGYDKENFMDNLAMNVARFANSVAKVMDVDARTVEVLELIRAGESESRSSKSSVKVVFIKFGILSRTLVEAAEKGNRLARIPADEVVAALRKGGLENVMDTSASFK